MKNDAFALARRVIGYWPAGGAATIELVSGESIRFDADADPVAATTRLEEAVRAL